MPYKDPERKRQWKQEHREQRNARRRIQRLDVGSGQPCGPKATPDIAAALHTHIREAFLTGFMLSPILDLIFSGAIPLYASYRLGLIEFLANRGCMPKQEVNKSEETTVSGSAEGNHVSSTDDLMVR